ncbi:hypothetical protein ANN_17177 [Periplaneta americana]|uniref:Uncharacterized protein n=1 Tax=Periplaneta americana TaxID=6978 RepID=A0ABQ8ST01_PERAM|nr:hypothetical protein ANN_17177 [Periplaneta americana]
MASLCEGGNERPGSLKASFAPTEAREQVPGIAYNLNMRRHFVTLLEHMCLTRLFVISHLSTDQIDPGVKRCPLDPRVTVSNSAGDDRFFMTQNPKRKPSGRNFKPCVPCCSFPAR